MRDLKPKAQFRFIGSAALESVDKKIYVICDINRKNRKTPTAGRGN